jgi:hypothetical protein
MSGYQANLDTDRVGATGPDQDPARSDRSNGPPRVLATELICPTGKSVNRLSSPICKNIPVGARPKSNPYLPPSRPTEGRLAIVTDAGRDAVDADGAKDEGA